ncbi:predicted protein [Uncinocarpus reesii 1704]|uniref:Protein kinase domain-containing protein n=1 Tax=Uncinocarpus reesii (strain UAMH 1704) TaxID=336963 RepID=C4JDP0_UNCRE|nr:uncharacterized protein UREG_00678 [Uncinocarpus reesii 1704]EEP75831.1 predicted protein [Uncinocarpus reesii 1704]
MPLDMPHPSRDPAIVYIFPKSEKAEKAIAHPHNDNRFTSVEFEGRKEILIGLRLGFDIPPKIPTKGFVFGSDPNSDVFLPSTDYCFSITFNRSTGVLLVKGISPGGYLQVIENNFTVSFDGFDFFIGIPDRAPHERAYRSNLSKFLRLKPEELPMIDFRIPICDRIDNYLKLESPTLGKHGKDGIYVDERNGGLFTMETFEPDDPRIVRKTTFPKPVPELHENVLSSGWISSGGRYRFVKEICHYEHSLEDIPSLGGVDYVAILHQCLKGIAHMHRNQLIHGNVRPSHILLGSTNPIRVKIPIHRPGKSNQTQYSGLLFVAPETRTDKVAFSKKIDLWALGITIMAVLKWLPVKATKEYLKDPRSDIAYQNYVDAVKNTPAQVDPPFRQVLSMMFLCEERRWSAEKCIAEIERFQRRHPAPPARKTEDWTYIEKDDYLESESFQAYQCQEDIHSEEIQPEKYRSEEVRPKKQQRKKRQIVRKRGAKGYRDWLQFFLS